MPLKLDMQLANTSEQIDSNIEASLRRKYIPFTDLLNKEQGTVSIVGSGPSLKETWRDLKKRRGDIVACNASNQFLLERGIVPKYVMIFDADILAEEFVTTPHEDVTYLLASRCHPKLFEHLEGYRVVVWHAKGDLNIERLLEKNKRMEPMIGGGSAAVTRSMFMVHPMGYRDMHLYGADSSYNNAETKSRYARSVIERDDLQGSSDASHIRRSTTVEKFLAIGVNGRVFHTTPWMAGQAEDFKVLAPSLQRLGMKISVHGDGLIPHLARAMHLDVDDQSRVKQIAREVSLKARTLWLNL